MQRTCPLTCICTSESCVMRLARLVSLPSWAACVPLSNSGHCRPRPRAQVCARQGSCLMRVPPWSQLCKNKCTLNLSYNSGCCLCNPLSLPSPLQHPSPLLPEHSVSTEGSGSCHLKELRTNKLPLTPIPAELSSPSPAPLYNRSSPTTYSQSVSLSSPSISCSTPSGFYRSCWWLWARSAMSGQQNPTNTPPCASRPLGDLELTVLLWGICAVGRSLDLQLCASDLYLGFLEHSPQVVVRVNEVIRVNHYTDPPFSRLSF